MLLSLPSNQIEFQNCFQPLVSEKKGHQIGQKKFLGELKKKTISKKPLKAKYVAKQPVIKFKAVKVLGIILFNDCTKILSF